MIYGGDKLIAPAAGHLGEQLAYVVQIVLGVRAAERNDGILRAVILCNIAVQVLAGDVLQRLAAAQNRTAERTARIAFLKNLLGCNVLR